MSEKPNSGIMDRYGPNTEDTDSRTSGTYRSNGQIPDINSTRNGNITDDSESLPNGVASSTDGDDEKNEPKSNYTAKQIITLLTLCALNTSSAMFYSLLAPFFPTEAKNAKGATEMEVGLILGCFQLVNLIMCPVFGYYMTSIGSKFLVVAGNFTCSVCAILFGMLQWCPPGRTFVIMCLVTRMVEAVGAAAQSTASYAIAVNSFPHKISSVMGFFQAASCIGLMAGPPIGGTLFAYGGYYLPFVVTGGLFMSFTLICIFLLPKSADTKAAATTWRQKLKVAKIPIIVIMGYMVFMGQAAIAFLDISLSLHLDEITKHGISAVYVGLIFLIPSAIVVLLAPICGLLTDKFKALGRPLLFIGSLTAGFAFLVLGPSPLFSYLNIHIPGDKVWVVIVSLVISSVGWGSMVVPYPQMVMAARRHGYPDNMETQGIISGINGAFNSLGALVGPTVGGVMLEQIKFPWSCTVIGGLAFIGCIFLMLYMIVTCFIPEKNYQTEQSDVEPNERTSLLQAEDNRSIQTIE